MRARSGSVIVQLITVLLLCVLTPCRGFTSEPVSGKANTKGILRQQQRPFGFSESGVRSAARALQAKNNNNNNSDEKMDSSSSWLLGLCLPLWFAYVSNQWSRSSIYYLVDFSGAGTAYRAMNVDIGFDQSQYGVLASVAFTTLFAVASLGAGVASDRYDRKTLTVASVAAWGVATLGTALSTSYSQVLLWRVAMGLACAFSTPTAYTLIQERVPSQQASLASSLYGTGVALGGALASLSILLDTQLGWRNALVCIAVFAFGSSALNLLVLPTDPKTKATASVATKNDNDSSVLTEVLEVVSTARVQWLFLGSFLRFCSGLMIGVWSAPYFRQVFPDNQADYAVSQALITAVCGVVSGLVGGVLADWVSSRVSNDDDKDAVGPKLWIPVVGSVLAAPAWYLAVHSDISFQLAMVWLAVEYLVAECWFGPTISVLQSTVGSKIGGTAQGLFTVTGAIGNLAPTVLGFLYSSQAGGGASTDLANLLSIGVCGGYLSSAACFAVSALSPPPPAPKTTKTQ